MWFLSLALLLIVEAIQDIIMRHNHTGIASLCSSTTSMSRPSGNRLNTLCHNTSLCIGEYWASTLKLSILNLALILIRWVCPVSRMNPFKQPFINKSLIKKKLHFHKTKRVDAVSSTDPRFFVRHS